MGGIFAIFKYKAREINVLASEIVIREVDMVIFVAF